MNRFIIIILLGFISCSCISRKKIPRNLDEAINYFEDNWTEQDKTDFIEDSLMNAHFSIGRWIRNNWIYDHQDTSLVGYFKNLEIYHPDDMSSIILSSLYRKMTNRPIELDSQINMYKAYWQPIIDCESRERKKAWANFQNISIGDEITVFLEVDTTVGIEAVVLRQCPDPEWTFDSNKDLKYSGVVTEKYHLGDTMNVFIKVKILKINKNIVSEIDDYKIGVIDDLSLNFLKFEKEK